jgi:hypothetical protein
MSGQRSGLARVGERAKIQGMEEVKSKRRPWVVYLLCLIPVWLLVSGGLGLWGYFQAQKVEEKKEAARFASVVSAGSIADDFHKLAVVIGARNSTVDEGKGLSRAASWIEGILGPSNTGYAVGKTIVPGTGGWPILRVDLRGSDEKAAPLWIVTNYESPSDEKGIAEASSAVVSMIAAAQALAGEKPRCPVRFVFLPEGHESSAVMVGRFVKLVGEEAPAAAILCVGSMRGGEGLYLATMDSSNRALAVLGSLGEVQPVEKMRGTLAAALFESGLPAVHVAANTLKEAAPETPEPEILAASTGRLVALIRRLMMGK